MNLTQYAYQYRKSVFMVLALLLLNGIAAYFTLPAQEDPNVTTREAIVSTSYPGMPPERVEQLITRTLEKEIRKIPEVKKITSISETGQSTIHVEVHDRYFNLENIWQDLRNKVNQSIVNLPQGTQTPYVNDSFGDVSVITLALTGQGFNLSQMNTIAKHISDTLYSVVGTKKIEIIGTQDERIYMEAPSAKLAQLGISQSLLIHELRTQNIISPGGQIDTGARNLVIEPTGNFDSLEEIGNTLITIPGTQNTLALKDIVSLRRDFIDPPHQPAYFNGESALLFSVAMLPEVNVLDFAKRIKAKVTDIQQTLPIGYKMDIATDQSIQVEKRINATSGNVFQTLIIVLMVVILFLGMRTGIIVGSIVPFVMLATLSIMKITGMALEQLAMSTLIIALGLLVDNGIVIAEDFKRRLELGTKRYDAMCQGGKELALPLLSSSATTILFFLPLMLAEHVAGEFTRSVSLVILITLLSSWLMALCITPLLCYFFIKVETDSNKAPTKITRLTAQSYQYYEGFLHWILAHKLIFMSGIVATFIITMSGMKFVENQFFPDSDRLQIMMYIDLPKGSSARATDKQMKEVFVWLNNQKRFPEIDSFSGYAGFNGPRFVTSLNPEDPADNKGFVIVNVKDDINLDALVAKLHTGVIENFPNVSGRIKRMFVGPSDSSVIKIQVKGPDKDVIFEKAQDIMATLHEVPNTKNIRTDWENKTVKILVDIDQYRARRAGITSEDIATALQSFFDGSQATQFREGDNIIPIVLQANAQERFNLDRLRTVSVYSNSTGLSVPLMQVANFKPVSQYSKIVREDMFRTISVLATSTSLSAQDLQLKIKEDVAAVASTLPVNHHIEYDGVITQSAEAQVAMGANMPMVICIVIVLLVIQFNSYRRALVIILTIPLSMIGATIGLLVMDAPFGFMVTLGIYSLAGIIINNAIVLIDRIDIERKSGIDDYQAIINACLTRLRPIAMTTITTIMGLLPLILDPLSIFYGMANVIAFGLGMGTILTLGAVPVLYAAFFKVNRPN